MPGCSSGVTSVKSFRRDAETDTRDGRASQNSARHGCRYIVGLLKFECAAFIVYQQSHPTAEIPENISLL